MQLAQNDPRQAHYTDALSTLSHVMEQFTLMARVEGRSKNAKALRRWLELRGFKPEYSDALFIDRKGEPLKPRWVQQVIARLGQKAGITGVRVSPHTLRHTAATLAVKNGMDPFALQRLFGWENIQTALKYVHMAGTALREAHAKASPVDRLLEG